MTGNKKQAKKKAKTRTNSGRNEPASDRDRPFMLSIVAYFSPDPSADQIGSTVHGIMKDVFELLDPPAIDLSVTGKTPEPTKQAPFRVNICEIDGISAGSLQRLDTLLELPSNADHVVAVSERRGAKASIDNFWWRVEYDHFSDGDWITDATLKVLINTDLFYKDIPGYRKAPKLVDRVINSISSIGSCSYAHVETVDSDDVNGGWYYSPSWFQIGPYRWHRVLNRCVWTSPTLDRTRHVRDVYWGQYLGPRLAQAFSHDADSVLASLKQAGHSTVRKPYARTLPNGGLFLALSDNPLWQMNDYLKSPNEACAHRAVLLRKMFMEKGVLA